jgi:hypothetical protein
MKIYRGAALDLSIRWSFSIEKRKVLEMGEQDITKFLL